jgi:hypothetical protein
VAETILGRVPRLGVERLTIVIVAMSCSVASAADWFDPDHQALPCRPTIACTANLVPPGSVEIEMGYLFRQLRAPATQHSVPLLAKLTLAEWVQLQVGGNGPSFVNAPVPTLYLDDLVAGFKFHLADQTNRRPSLSWSVALSSPISSAPGFTRSYDLLYTLYVTKDFRWLHADLNLGLNLWQLEGPTRPQPWVALALSVELPHRFTVMAESYYFADASPISSQDGGLLAALAYAPRRWIVLDVGGDVGYFQSKRAYSLFAGATLFIVDLWQTELEHRRLVRER